MVMCSLIQAVINLDVATYCKLASYPAFPTPRYLSLFHTASDKYVVVGKAGYKATVSNDISLHGLFH